MLSVRLNQFLDNIGAMKTYEKIEEVIEHLLYSEMGGEVDYSDPWYPTFKSLHELKEKTFEEEEGRPCWLDVSNRLNQQEIIREEKQ